MTINTRRRWFLERLQLHFWDRWGVVLFCDDCLFADYRTWGKWCGEPKSEIIQPGRKPNMTDQEWVLRCQWVWKAAVDINLQRYWDFLEDEAERYFKYIGERRWKKSLSWCHTWLLRRWKEFCHDFNRNCWSSGLDPSQLKSYGSYKDLPSVLKRFESRIKPKFHLHCNDNLPWCC